MNAPEIITLPSQSGAPLKLELRWGIEECYLNQIKMLHEAAFPLSYNEDYYEWLLSESCVAIVAYVSPNTLTFLINSMNFNKNVNDKNYGKNYNEVKTNDVDVDNNDNNDENSNSYNDSTIYSIPVGFSIGRFAYGRRRDGLLLPSPTGYLCSFAVDPLIRCRGVGELLLQRFIYYMLFKIPVPRFFCLDYQPESLKIISTSWWKKIGEFFTIRSEKWSFNNKRGEKIGKDDEIYLEEQENSNFEDFSSLVSHSDIFQYGVEEVWLHCLAENKKLVRYYILRGFIPILQTPDFYMFDGRYHDGMLLCFSRSNSHGPFPNLLKTSSIVNSSSIYDSASNDLILASANDMNTSSNSCLPLRSNPSNKNKFDFLIRDNGKIILRNWGNGIDSDIMDLECSDDYTRLRQEYSHNIKIVSNNQNNWTKDIYFVLKALLMMMGVTVAVATTL